MARQITCAAGEWTVIFDHAFVQLPNAWTVMFATLDGAPVEGEVITKYTTWIFPQPPKVQPLLPVMTFRRGYWNTFYSVRIKPTQALIAQIN